MPRAYTCPGARYHIELSRQLADFLATPLSRCGGLLSLPDVYCLFNRARGTELVSPDDLLQVRACARGCVRGPAERAQPCASVPYTSRSHWSTVP